MWATSFSTTAGRLTELKKPKFSQRTSQCSANTATGPLKAIKSNVGRSRWPEKELLFPEMSFHTQSPILLSFSHNSSSFPLFSVGPGEGGSCAEHGKSPTLFSESWNAASTGFQQWRFAVYSSSHQELKGSAIVSVKRLDREEGFFFYQMWRTSISTRAISLILFCLLRVLQITQPQLSSAKQPPHPLTSCCFFHVPSFLQTVSFFAHDFSSDRVSHPKRLQQLQLRQNQNSSLIFKAPEPALVNEIISRILFWTLQWNIYGIPMTVSVPVFVVFLGTSTMPGAPQMPSSDLLKHSGPKVHPKQLPLDLEG
jgi:hypothetical protein